MVVVVRPAKPILTPARLDDLYSSAVLAGRASPGSRTFEVTIRELRLADFCACGNSPARNRTRDFRSVITSTLMWFKMSMICAPLSIPESSEGESVSPGAAREEGRPLGALTRFTTAATLAGPPRPSALLHTVDVVRLRKTERHRFPQRQGAARGGGENEGEEGVDFSVGR